MLSLRDVLSSSHHELANGNLAGLLQGLAHHRIAFDGFFTVRARDSTGESEMSTS
jgi:hypothetical protein